MEIITVPRPLREKLGEVASDSLIELLNKSSQRLKEDVLAFVEEKFERRLTEEISKVNEKITSEISKVEQKISESQANMIKWMFIFWLGQIGALIGILFAFFKP